MMSSVITGTEDHVEDHVDDFLPTFQYMSCGAVSKRSSRRCIHNIHLKHALEFVPNVCHCFNTGED
jgi:hypothetical protein